MCVSVCVCVCVCVCVRACVCGRACACDLKTLVFHFNSVIFSELSVMLIIVGTESLRTNGLGYHYIIYHCAYTDYRLQKPLY